MSSPPAAAAISADDSASSASSSSASAPPTSPQKSKAPPSDKANPHADGYTGERKKMTAEEKAEAKRLRIEQQKEKSKLKKEQEKLKKQQAAAQGASQQQPQQQQGGTGSEKIQASTSSSSSQQQSQTDTAKLKTMVPSTLQFDDAKARTKVEKSQLVQRIESQKQIALFSHLPQYVRGESITSDISILVKHGIHPAVIQLGLRYLNNQIVGANARCIAMLTAFKQMINDFTPPDQAGINRHFDALLKANVQYLVHYRPLATTMGNAIRALKRQIAAVPDSEQGAKNFLIEFIDRYIQERIVYADTALAQHAVTKIHSGDVILTYGCSSIVQRILQDAYDEGKKFRVIIVDSRPKLEGKVLLQRLVKHGIPCSYVLLNGLAYIMKEVSKVIIGATCMFSNGNMMSRVGTASVAIMAAHFNVPVLVCCETYKFSERVQLDSFVSNELGDADDLKQTGNGAKSDLLVDWRNIQHLKLLNLYYDVTPMQYLNVIITDIGLIPATSVPVVLREYQP